MAKKPPRPSVLLAEIEDIPLREKLRYLGEEIVRLRSEGDTSEQTAKEKTAELAALCEAHEIPALKSEEWSAGPKGWRSEQLQKQELLRSGWEVECPHCGAEVSVTVPLPVVDAAMSVKTGVAWSLTRRGERKKGGEE